MVAPYPHTMAKIQAHCVAPVPSATQQCVAASRPAPRRRADQPGARLHARRATPTSPPVASEFLTLWVNPTSARTYLPTVFKHNIIIYNFGAGYLPNHTTVFCKTYKSIYPHFPTQHKVGTYPHHKKKHKLRGYVWVSRESFS